MPTLFLCLSCQSICILVCLLLGCTYKHPKLDINEFNTLFENTMEKFSFVNKELYLLGDFNIDLLKTDDDANIDEFYNIISSNFLVPHITLPTRITSTSRTLTDNIFSNNLNFVHAVSGNLTVSISDHLPQAKPWITNGIRSSIKGQDKLLRKFIKTKDEVLKHELYATYKTLRNKIVSLNRVGKKLHFQKYFMENCKDIRKTWSGIKNVIDIRNFNKGQPASILIDGEISNDPNKIANGFYNYF